VEERVASIDVLRTHVAAYMKQSDVQRIDEAYAFAANAHAGQTRKSGEPYILHPLAVAAILVELQMDATTVICGLLHDVVEDTPITPAQIESHFGKTCRALVDGLTKLEKFSFQSKTEHKNENYRKMFVAMAQDIRVILIKLADRLHNMRTLKHQSEEAQRRIAEETLEIFCPIAHRLGIAAMRWEMEDIALRYLNPQQYYRIAHLMQKKRAERERHIDEVIAAVRARLNDMHINADLNGRPKHIYSIYKKMKEKDKQFNEIYDLLAIRVIVDNVKDCYAALGIIHTLWKPMPGRFKDYIAMPKPNMYQSLHTTVIGPSGEPTEVQIRTWDMHRTSEYGIAAHWAYKEGKDAVQARSFEDKMTFFRGILELQHETQDASEFMESLRVDFFSDLVYVFTPKGEVIELPAGSVPLDFAYRIHTEIGNKTIGAKINGRIVALDTVLKTGDIVEILTSKHSYGPSQDWLKIAKSSHARSKIRQWFKREKREDYAAKRVEPIEPKKGEEPLSLPQTAEPTNVFPERRDGKLHKPTKSVGRAAQGVHVKGIENLLVRFARCCNPVPGDEIIGYITRGRGVSVHRVDCPNLAVTEHHHEDEPHRVIEVEWTTVESSYSVDIEITGHDRRGLLNEVLQAVSESKTNMAAVTGRSDKNKFALIHMTILIRNTAHLQSVVEKIKRVRDVYSVQRIMHS
jgi:GTP pyrophosphokinase